MNPEQPPVQTPPEAPANPAAPVAGKSKFVSFLKRHWIKFAAAGVFLILLSGGLLVVAIKYPKVTPKTNEQAASPESPVSETEADTATTETDDPADTPAPDTTQAAEPSAGSNQTSSSTPTPTPEPEPQPTNQTYYVTYTSGGFSSASLSIENGDTVVFINNSGSTAKIASDPHPSHTNYPEFVSGDISSGDIYSFKFTKNGSWGYHDHHNPSKTGTITVH